MNRTSQDHELVRRYLGEVRAALRGMPATRARELEEQIVAHLDDAVPPDADDEQIAAVLTRLGTPAELAAESGPPDAAPRAALSLTRVWLRRRLARVRRRTWATLGVIAVLAGTGAFYLVDYAGADSLQWAGEAGWWYPQDYNHAVDSSADGVAQTTVPIRTGQWQGIAITIVNPSDVTETVLGPGYGNGVPLDSPGSEFVHISVSGPSPDLQDGGYPRSLPFSLPGVIPPHQYRVLRVLWVSRACFYKGDEGIIDTFSLRVRIGWFTKTELIPLDQGWAVKGPSQGPCPY